MNNSVEEWVIVAVVVVAIVIWDWRRTGRQCKRDHDEFYRWTEVDDLDAYASYLHYTKDKQVD